MLVLHIQLLFPLYSPVPPILLLTLQNLALTHSSTPLINHKLIHLESFHMS